MAKPRTGSLVWRASGWRAVVRFEQDGKQVRKWKDLETSNRSVARRKMNALVRRLASGELKADDVETATLAITVSEFAVGYYERREASGVKTWKDERRWFRGFLEPHIGAMDVTRVSGADIQDAVDLAIAQKRPHESLKKIRVEAMRLFREMRRAELIPSNPVDLVTLPKDRRRKLARVILADSEFVAYVKHPDTLEWEVGCGKVDFELKVMGILARTLGGLRTSDLHALVWDVVDRTNYERCVVYRPKTNTEDTYVVPEVARPFLKAWHQELGNPETGPMFPVRKGRRAGKVKKKASHAHRLRRDLLIAGVTRHEVHNDTDRTRCCDFHSFRRAFATALRTAKVDARDAMRLTSHTSFETHQGYVRDDGPIQAPPVAALPLLPAVSSVARRNHSKRRASRNQGKTVGVRGFEPPTAGTQIVVSEQIQALGEISASDDHSRSAVISGNGCEPATDEEALAEVLLLPALPLSPLEHATKLAALAAQMLTEGRVAPAAGILRALQKVLAKAGETSASGDADAILDARGVL